MGKVWTLVSSGRGRSVVAALVLTLAVVGAVNLDHRTARQRADAWASSHASATMTLEELAAYPAEYRQAMFQALPPETQSQLWHTQLQRVLDTEQNLTTEQRAFIVNVMAMATPASFMKDMPKPEVCADIAALFTNPKQKEMVRTIATGAQPSRSFGATWVKAAEKLRSTVSLSAGKADCDCRGLGICECGLVVSCIYGDCTHTNNCGCIWSGECDKVCASNIPDMNLVVSPGSGGSKK